MTNIKRFVVPTLAVGTGIRLARRLFATAATAKPAAPGASYEAIDAYVDGISCCRCSRT